MPKFLYEILQEAEEQLIPEGLTLSNGEPYTVQHFKETRAVLNALMSTSGKPHNLPHLDMGEALATPDISIAFPTAISDVLLRPKEPQMIAQTLLAKTITMPTVRQIEFPTLGAIRAFDIAETREIPEQALDFHKYMTEVKVQKTGLRLALSQDVIKDSMWDLLALYTEAAGYAMLRHKEEKIFREFTAKSQVIFDNTLADANAWTSGRNEDQTLNGSFGFNDYVDLLAALLANGYTPTDMVLHPLCWSVFAKDPILRFQTVQRGIDGISTAEPGSDAIPSSMAWNVKTQVTPFTSFTRSATAAAGTPGSGTVANLTDILVIDRNNGLLILQKDPMGLDQFEDPRRDIQELKLTERYGLAAMNGGMASVVAKNVRLVDNYEPLPWVQRTYTV